ncbi:hypothetical protein Q0812_09425 [Brevundimonas sp. 2R-24]|uniref:ANR family transcriptional regulator n=1 Tax=Peiella sedimenti TaxID=3061083 RepID=A0ABT8SM57_9CAUL|nr:hypothetical protein [Caulobacteraceae bacterium XZ-24]
MTVSAYLQNARTCERRAQEERNPRRRETWLRMARDWRERARSAGEKADELKEDR